MITSITIQNCRGIRTGTVEGLAPLTIFTGPNGSGKSTVLDALLIAAGMSADSVGEAVKRHPVAKNSARWLIGQWNEQASITLTVTEDRVSRCICKLKPSKTP